MSLFKNIKNVIAPMFKEDNLRLRDHLKKLGFSKDDVVFSLQKVEKCFIEFGMQEPEWTSWVTNEENRKSYAATVKFYRMYEILLQAVESYDKAKHLSPTELQEAVDYSITVKSHMDKVKAEWFDYKSSHS
ncbi:MAG: hypothetical protein J6V89_07225 [Acetobacter sp.]|nr:hypothetical protein [Acetobacter sp.]